MPEARVIYIYKIVRSILSKVHVGLQHGYKFLFAFFGQRRPIATKYECINVYPEPMSIITNIP